MFGGGFKAAKCKTLLRLAMSRIKLLRNKRDVVIKQMRRDIAQLLSSGQDTNARIRVEHIAREQNIMAAYDLIELFCELIIVRLPIIDSHKVCPMDLKEAISSLIFASPRCADLPELLQIRTVFSSKYGKEFVAAALELRPDCGVNRKVVEKLSVRTPGGETKVKILTEIAEEFHINWDPAATLAELLKQPEDLLDGPTKFGSSRDAPLPEAPGVKPSKAIPQPPAASDPQRNNSNHASIQTNSSPLRTNQPADRPQKAAPGFASLSLFHSRKDENRGHNRFRNNDGAVGEPSPRKSQAPAKPTSTPPPPARPPPNRSPSSAGFPPNDIPTRNPGGGMPNRGGLNPPADYDNVAEAARAAAECADRAVAAARAAARLATSEPSFDADDDPPHASSRSAASTGPKFDTEPDLPPPRGGRAPYHSSSSSDDDADQRFSIAHALRNCSSSSSREHHHDDGSDRAPLPSAKSSSCYIASDSYYRRSNGDGYRP